MGQTSLKQNCDNARHKFFASSFLLKWKGKRWDPNNVVILVRVMYDRVKNKKIREIILPQIFQMSNLKKSPWVEESVYFCDDTKNNKLLGYTVWVGRF